jgi:hypothetical protein
MALGGIVLCFAHGVAEAQPPEPECHFKPQSALDHLLLKGLAEHNLRPAPLCRDDVFIRRIYLDLIGCLPPAERTRDFLHDRDPAKRKRLIDALLTDERFSDYWTLKWCDLLRVKAEYPINLWPNGVQAYAHWIHEAIKSNMPYDTFARHLLTTSGSNFRAPAVNFYRAVQGDTPQALAAAAALTFMGTRIDTWPDTQRAPFEAIFSRVAFKGTAEWKETIVHLNPSPSPPLKLTMPDGLVLRIPAEADPRITFANWLLSPNNTWFARNLANRAWSWFFSYGLIHEPDDIRPGNPPVHPSILAYLERELASSGYDMRHLFRTILLSATYQQSCVPVTPSADATRLFAHYPLRRLDAEVLLDALTDFSGHHDSYSSPIPEPFTFIPEELRAIELTDGSITSPFLKMFGRPGRDTGIESERSRAITKEQRLHLINSTHIMEKLKRSGTLFAGKGREEQLNSLYLTTLARYPTDEEREIAYAYLERSGLHAARQDLIWAVVNSKEFLHQH